MLPGLLAEGVDPLLFVLLLFPVVLPLSAGVLLLPAVLPVLVSVAVRAPDAVLL